MIVGTTSLFALLGHPVGHSMSPVMQNAVISFSGIDAVYLAFDVAPDNLGKAVAGLQSLGVSGINVTVPHKEAVLEMMDDLSLTAAAVGAVNTIVLDNGRLYGHNTDVPGIIRALREDAGRPITGERYLVAGAGGVARAACYALLTGGAEKVYLANRTVSRAEALCDDLAGIAGGRMHSLALADINALRGGVDVLINATSAGLHPLDDLSPLDMAGYDIISKDMLVYDLIYNPSPTKLMRIAESRGASVMDGLGMLVYQGAESLQLWLDRQVPVKVMKQALSNYLGNF